MISQAIRCTMVWARTFSGIFTRSFSIVQNCPNFLHYRGVADGCVCQVFFSHPDPYQKCLSVDLKMNFPLGPCIAHSHQVKFIALRGHLADAYGQKIGAIDIGGRLDKYTCWAVVGNIQWQRINPKNGGLFKAHYSSGNGCKISCGTVAKEKKMRYQSKVMQLKGKKWKKEGLGERERGGGQRHRERERERERERMCVRNNVETCSVFGLSVAMLCKVKRLLCV